MMVGWGWGGGGCLDEVGWGRRVDVQGAKRLAPAGDLALCLDEVGFESLLERRENFLLQGRLSVLTLISVSVPPPRYHSST